MKITVCGSIAFYTQMESVRDQLKQIGHEAKIPELALEVPEEFGSGKNVYFGKYVEDNGGIDAFAPDHALWSLKEGAIRDHFEKIEWSDGILVSNYEKRGVDGYVGGNTLMEIALAFYLRKPIYILNPVSSSLSYKQEILGMKPICINGNLEAIPL